LVRIALWPARVDDLSVECFASAQFKLSEQRGEFLVDGYPELFAGLALDDSDEALVDITRPMSDMRFSRLQSRGTARRLFSRT
jgi:hypothetical protein